MDSDIPVTEEELRDYPGEEYAPEPPSFRSETLQQQDQSSLSRLDKRRNEMKFTPREIETQLDKILKSATFRRVRQLQSPLRFVVKRALENPDWNSPNAYEIGTSSMGQPETFNPHDDCRVRVAFVRIKAKLNAYYDSEGKDDPIVIGFGFGYTPHFDPRGDSRNLRLRPSDRALVERCCSVLTPEHAAAAELLRETFLPLAEAGAAS